MSRNGEISNDLVLNYTLKIISSATKCSVIFIRITSKIPNEKCIIAYVITSTESTERVISKLLKGVSL